MTNATYRAGIVGLGFIGGADQVSGDALGQRVVDLDGTHFDALSSHPRVNIVAGSSRDAGRRERFVQRTEAAVYADWKEMLAQEALDVVSVATYAPVHAEITVACAEQEIRAIYCEKPIATRLPDAEQMVAACDKTGALLVLNHQRRFQTSTTDDCAILSPEDGLGELTSGLLQWGSGRLGNVGTHMIDALLMLTGRRIEAVSATLDLAGKPDCRGPAFRDPGGWGVLKLEGGIMVMVDAGDYATVPGRIILNGTEGRAISDGSSVTLEYWGRTCERVGIALAMERQGWTGPLWKSWCGLMTEPNFRTPPPKLSIRWKLSSAFTLHTLEMRRGRNSRYRVQTVNAKSYVGNDAREIPQVCNKGRNMKREGAKFLKVLCFFVSITLALVGCRGDVDKTGETTGDGDSAEIS